MKDITFKGESLFKMYEIWLTSDEFHGLNPEISDLDMDVSFIEWMLWLHEVPFVPRNILKQNYKSFINRKENISKSTMECIKEILEREVA